ncbi:hypothetical protein ACH3XW_18285 [Acanthocheilonema viteae]|uniref:Uncharacterized protein n=1 Tax=Acanthocheilonema viteae TaxID=6277 RepID=A0A498S7C5_ACAVI|nr:unnamed protein product [Acanthocheilonema viteae]
MLGLVNLPSESVDFYAQPKSNHSNFAFLGQGRNKSTVSYTDDGRRIINGKVVDGKEPHEMWCNLLINLFIKSIARRSDESIGIMYERRVNDSPETVSVNDTVMKPILPEDMLNPKSTMLTAMCNPNSKNGMLVNRMIRCNANNEDD